MEPLVFYVMGSSPEPYQVSFRRNGDNLTAHCTCPAGQNGLYCKHRFRLIAGELTGLISDNKEQVSLVGEMARGTDVEQALEAVMDAEQAVLAAKKELKARKKALARAMMD